MVARFIALASLLCGAEVAASWGVWGRAPTDTIRDWYAGFWAFEAGRLHYWVPVFASLLTVWIVAWYALRPHDHAQGIQRRYLWWLFVAASGVGSEVLASALYWRSARSSDLRSLFESTWYWDRVPQASDMGWPSFQGYLWAHLAPWTVFLLLGLGGWSFWRRWRGIHPVFPQMAGGS
jgi:hypothetical protein